MHSNSAPPVRRISVRRRLGEESRDDSQHSPPQGSFRPIQAQHQDDDDDEDYEDEIPCLIDEDQDRYSSPIDTTNMDHNDDDHRFPWQRAAFSTPKRPQAKPSLTPIAPTSAPAATNQQQQSNDSPMPFFVLDWMIEDLVPQQQNAQDLAILLQEQEYKSTYSPLRMVKSENNAVIRQQKASPMLQRLLPWSKTPPQQQEQQSVEQSYRPSTPPPKESTTSSDSECPTTPKSSNRKSCKLRQQNLLDDDTDAPVDELSLPMVPRNLDESLKHFETKASNPANLDPSPVANTTTKSKSCPQLCQQQDQTLQQRAKEQLDRRERRNKLTVFQRSLTLAQGWNNKGLAMAGNATRAEQQHPPSSSNPWWESALECWDNALEIYRSLLGESHERVADVQNNRGIALGKLGQFEKAFEALGMALEARKKQHHRGHNQQEEETEIAPSCAAIVSTLHNIANVFRDAGNPSEALRILAEAQQTLELQHDDDDCSWHHLHHSWHQSARLSTAIGHVYYESQAWREARTAYGEALTMYYQLQKSLEHHQANGDELKRLEIVQHHQLIQREIAVLERDLDDLERSQQAKDGSRARLLQARKQQQQQQQQHHRKSSQQQQRSSPQPQQEQQTLLGIVSSLRA